MYRESIEQKIVLKMNQYIIEKKFRHQNFDTFFITVITRNKYLIHKEFNKIRCISILISMQYRWFSMHFRGPFDALLSSNFELYFDAIR